MAASLRAHILSYLASVSASDPEDESLEVAIQCLRESFERSSGSLPEVPPTALVDIFEAGVAATKGVPAAAPATTADMGFQRFVENLRGRGYFKGVEPGSAEYEKRLQSARARFDARFARSSTSGEAQPAATPASTVATAVGTLLSQGEYDRAAEEAAAAIDGEGVEEEELADLLGLRALALVATVRARRAHTRMPARTRAGSERTPLRS